MSKLQILEDEIGRKLTEASDSGELKSARGYGMPLQEIAGWAETPVSLRMPFKILKDAGVIPAEIEMMKFRAQLKNQLNEVTDPEVQRAILQKLSQLEQAISLRLEALRSQG